MKWTYIAVALAFGIPSGSASAGQINFDDVSASAGGTLFSGDTFASAGVVFTSGSMPNSIAVGDVFTLGNLANQLLLVANSNSISRPNFAAASGSFSGAANDMLMSFDSPVTSVMLTTDRTSEVPDVVRLLALEATGNPSEFRVLALAEGLDNATTSPGNLLSIDLGGASFSFALFQSTTEPEGFDDLSFTPAAVPEPSALALSLLGGAGLLFIRRRGRDR